jgi:hypothetical protein
MNNNVLQIKIKERLNKLASMDYDNLECWQIAEAFNKAQIEWVRRQVHGNNATREGDESSKMLIDDLQRLLTDVAHPGVQKEVFFESATLPADYLFFKRFTVKAKKECCPDRRIVAYLAEEADVDNLLFDHFRRPSFEWGETFATLGGNRAHIYTDNEFEVTELRLVYYRKPVMISFTGCVDIATGNPTTNVECEFKDDVVELLIEETCLILAGDIESPLQIQRNTNNVIRNN